MQDGTPTRRQEDPSRVRASRASGGRASSDRSGEATGSFNPVQRPGDWRSYLMPRRGPPVAVVKAPRWHRPVVVEERRPRGPEPRGPLRGGPERSSDDPQRAPRASRWGGPGRSSDDPRLSKTTQAKGKRETKGQRGAKWPAVVTADKSGKEKKWGRLSRTAAWKAGCFWEESKEEVKIGLVTDPFMFYCSI